MAELTTSVGSRPAMAVGLCYLNKSGAGGGSDQVVTRGGEEECSDVSSYWGADSGLVMLASRDP
jgi:hypothetical protein